MTYHTWDVGIAAGVYSCWSELCLRTVPFALMLGAAQAVNLPATKSLILISGSGKFLLCRNEDLESPTEDAACWSIKPLKAAKFSSIKVAVSVR